MEGMNLLQSKENGLTWREVKEMLDKATPDQLESPALLWAIDNETCTIPGGVILEFYQTTEDFINPSGEGAEPVSLYEDHEILDEEVVIKKGNFIGFI